MNANIWSWTYEKHATQGIWKITINWLFLNDNVFLYAFMCAHKWVFLQMNDY